jgi:diadenosine tetraphosphate (Ap4A) HIT family hydrolase
MSFELLPGLAKKMDVIELEKSIVKFESNYKECPWIFVIPKIENKGNFTDLTKEQQVKLMDEVSLASDVMNEVFNPDRINVAMIGNMTPQIHVHVICRYENDPHWPGTIWNTEKSPMTDEAAAKMIAKIKEKFEEKSGA